MISHLRYKILESLMLELIRTRVVQMLRDVASVNSKLKSNRQYTQHAIVE